MTMKDTYYLRKIRDALDDGNAYKIVYNISRIIKEWEKGD